MLLVAPLFCATVNMTIDRVIYRPIRNASKLAAIVSAIGVSFVFMNIGVFWMGSYPLNFPDLVSSRNLLDGTGLRFTYKDLMVICVTVPTMIALTLFVRYTTLGKAMRAMSDNADLAQVSGINTQLVVRVTWIIAGALACAAGTMLALDVSLKPDLAFNIVLPIFAAAIVGGLGQAYGAIAGGFLLGFAETLGVFNWSTILKPLGGVLPDWIVIPPDLSIVPTEYKLTVSFVILVITLLWRPTGIFKGQST